MNQFTPTNKQIKINENDSFIDVKIDYELYYSARYHASVGIDVICIIDNNEVISLESTNVYWNKPQIKGITGGDNGQKVFIFKALKIGKTNLIIKHIFRGVTKNEFVVKLNVLD